MIPPRVSLQKIHAYTPGEYRQHAIKLSSNENPLGTSPRAMKAFKRLQDLSRYPEPSAEGLRQKVASLYQLNDNHIIIGNGSGEVLLLIAAAFLSAQEKVLIAEHTFSLYEFSTLLFDGIPVKVPMRATGWLDLGTFAEYLHQHNPRMVILCNPNNPTGTVFDKKQLIEFLQIVPDTTAVVVDEAYADYAENFSSAIPLLSEFPNLIVLRTFSKIYGLAGLRVGYGIAHTHIIKPLHRVRLPFNTSVASQQVAAAALEDRKFVQHSLKNNHDSKKIIETFLTENNIPFFPSQANFICIQCLIQADLMAEELAVRGITVRSLKSFGLPFHIRVTIGKKPDVKKFCSLFFEITSQ